MLHLFESKTTCAKDIQSTEVSAKISAKERIK